MALTRRQSARHSVDVWRDVVGAVDGTVGRRWCQESVVDEAGCGAALGLHGSGRGRYPIGKRLGQVWSAVQSGYSTREGMWGSGSLRQGSKEHVTGWSVTTIMHTVQSGHQPLSPSTPQVGLKGIDVPEKSERLIVTLFTDNTTVYLSKEDEISKLEVILEDWHKAAQAKFNVSKTIVMPIRELMYRQNVLQTQRTQPKGGQIPAHMTILREGKATQILGAWYGNGVKISVPWSIVLTKLTKLMEQ
jgi:hypothetical protein